MRGRLGRKWPDVTIVFVVRRVEEASGLGRIRVEVVGLITVLE